MKKKIMLVTAGFILAIAGTQAQTPGTTTATMGKTTFGIRAGVNFQNINGEYAGQDYDYDIKTGFNAGLTVDIPVAPDFYVQTGLLYATKGAKIDEGGYDRINIGYLELPINFLYKPMLGSGNLLLGFGPYVAYGINGDVKYTNDDKEDIEFKNELDTNDPFDILKTYRRFDAGANLLFGYEFSNRFSAQLNAQLGLVKINPEYQGFLADDDAKARNTGFGISLGYKF